MIDQKSIEDLKNNIDIVDILSNYVELKRAGSNFKAKCPYHDERTPSFVVSPSKQIYHCFSCGVGGDAISFVREFEHLSYPEAIEKIASLLNFSLSYSERKSSFTEERRVLEQLQAWYILSLSKNTSSLQYLKDRGITPVTIKDFGIGFVGKSADTINFLNQNMLPLPLADKAGVLSQNENGGYYSRLNERITFPIYNPSGGIVGFSGRTVTNHPAKYVNSPQTKLFNKSQLLYAYHLAKTAIYRNKRLIIVEGQIDVVMMHQAGLKETVATLGTALTKEHLPTLKRGEPSIILAYDGDRAGKAAALKASILLAQNSFYGTVVLFPEGKDPADIILKGNSEIFSILENGVPLVSFAIQAIADKFNLNDGKDREQAFRDIKDFIGSLSPIMRDSYIEEASRVLGVSVALFNIADALPTNEEGTKSKINIGRLCLIKTLLEQDYMVDYVSKFISPDMMEEDGQLYDDVINGRDNPTKVAILIDETIKTLDDDELEKSMIGFQTKYYTRQLVLIRMREDIPTKEKMFQLKKIRMMILPQIKKGDLVML